jgi:hypothetical protein
MSCVIKLDREGGPCEISLRNKTTSPKLRSMGLKLRWVGTWNAASSGLYFNQHTVNKIQQHDVKRGIKFN